MIAYQLENWVYTGQSVEVGAIAPPGYTFVPPVECASDEVSVLINGVAVAVKKDSLISEPLTSQPQNIALLKKSKSAEIESIRAEIERTGCPFVFGTVGDLIQTRDERDFININGVATNAMLLKTAGETGAVIPFRAKSDTSYMLTPDQAIALGKAVANRATALYAIQWALKDQIAAAETAEEINAIKWPEN